MSFKEVCEGAFVIDANNTHYDRDKIESSYIPTIYADCDLQALLFGMLIVQIVGILQDDGCQCGPPVLPESDHTLPKEYQGDHLDKK